MVEVRNLHIYQTHQHNARSVKTPHRSGRLSISMAALALLVGENVVSPSSDYGQDRTILLPFVTVDKGFTSGIRERRFVVMRTREEWEELWRVHRLSSHRERKIPPVDFDQEMIVVVFSGEKRTGGYGIEIIKIEEDRGKCQINVIFRETQPPPDAMVIQVLTQPYHIVKTKIVGFPVMFVSPQESPQP